MKPSSASLLTATLLLTDIATAAATCYRLDGTPFAKIRPDDGDWVPCDASASTSSCCSVKDYCLGNGLCLDAGANNYFSVQGCTDASWGSPCVTNAACKSNIQDGYSFIWPCGQVTNSTYNYCCGPSPSCCTVPSAVIVIPAVTAIDRPSPTTTSSPTAATATATITVAPSPAATSGQPDGKILAIGLGAGLGTGLLLLGAILAAVVWHSRRKPRPDYRESVATSTAGGGRPGSTPIFGDAYGEEDKGARNQDPAPGGGGMGMGGIMPVPVPLQHGYATTGTAQRYPELEGRNLGAPGGMGSWDNHGGQMSRNTDPGVANANNWYGGAGANSHHP